MFASCDGDGTLDVWNINQSVEIPVAHKKAADRPLNSVKWSMDGKKIAVGDAEGYLTIFNVDKELYHPKEDDAMKMVRKFMSQ